MSEADFSSTRRQSYLSEKYYLLNKKFLKTLLNLLGRTIEHEHRKGRRDRVQLDVMFRDSLKLLTLYYTAGDPIDTLKPMYSEIAHWFEAAHVAHKEYIEIAKQEDRAIPLYDTPYNFEELFNFQLMMDLISIGVLLGDGDSLRKIDNCIGSYSNQDLLFETLINPAVQTQIRTQSFFHQKPYELLLDAVYIAKTPEQASEYVKQYLDNWYSSFRDLSWHNGHLSYTSDYMAYFGYWSFEAAAICLIFHIDDSHFRDHAFYPKDLADWAWSNGSLDKLRPRR